MKKDRNIEQSHDSYKERLRHNIENQLEMLDEVIRDLMDGIDVKALPLKERLMLTTRFVALYQHGIAITDALGINQQESRQNLAFSAIIRNLRADKEKGDFRIVDAEITSYPRIEDDVEG